MRIITGTARGAVLKTLEGETTRPTPSKVKEAIFSSLQFDLEGRQILDLFAGSGQMGLEALSRDAARCTFVDADRAAIGIVTDNAKKTKLYPKSNVLCMDWEQYIRSAAHRGTFDIVFLDPPYAEKLLPRVLCALYDGEMVKGTSILVCEDERELDVDGDVMLSERYEVIKKAQYGRVHIAYLRPKTEE